MQHCMKLGQEFKPEEDRYSEEHTGFDLQCGDSLTIAANRIGEDIFGMTWLLRGLRILRHAR